MTDQTALEAHVESGRAKVEALLRRVASNPDVRADRATTHLLAAGGKRMRPTLVMVTALLGPNPECDDVVTTGAVMELTHVASLYHDDVMDDATMRRGVPAAQEIFGNRVAIMAGDILFATASELVAELGPRAVRSHALTFVRLCMGQLHEGMGPAAGESRRDHYLSVLSDKTASLIAESAQEGVYAAGGSAEDAAQVARYGEKVGVAFQLADDYLDIMFDGANTGKTPGTDLREGVDTMPTILLREHEADGTLDAAGQHALAGIAAGVQEDAALAEVVDALRQSAVMGETLALAKEWAREGIDALDGLHNQPVREALVEFARHSVERSA